MSRGDPHPVVHLELHTREKDRARAFYEQLCGWRGEQVQTPHGCYDAVELGGTVGGGIVQCPTARALWLPYVEVEDVGEMTARAGRLGARVMLAPREGPAGWRCVVATPQGGEIAFWQPKR